MRVLLWMLNGDRIPGGHRVQIDQTHKHLRMLGVDAEITFQDSPSVQGYDLVHGFGLGPAQIRQCRQAGLRVVLSTIYPGRAFVLGQHMKNGKAQELKWRSRIGLVLLRSAMQGKHVEKCQILVERLHTLRVAFEMADLLLPNSQGEATALKEELDVTAPCHIVPNAVDPTGFTIKRAVDDKARAHALYVGRFEPHKNQLGLIEAMRDSQIPVHLAGYPHPHHMAYYEACCRRATQNITILPGVPHDELPDLYNAAKIHVLPSWLETTGLVSLEAALCGCNIVTTSLGHTTEYFQDMAWYCDPADPASIRQAVEAAYHAPYRSELRERISQNFTWEHTARATLQAYGKVLSQRPL
ncbi:MAG TPA: glycosyltransferase family 4 protein [Abditibacteriaceae bacterium]|nr:glycosyltransferase family 4 protein [Abditibacteriaceae bacterium]